MTLVLLLSIVCAAGTAAEQKGSAQPQMDGIGGTGFDSEVNEKEDIQQHKKALEEKDTQPGDNGMESEPEYNNENVPDASNIGCRLDLKGGLFEVDCRPGTLKHLVSDH
jgi:hypothetical protein